MKLQDLIKRKFTAALELPENSDKTVFDLFRWSKRDVKLNDYKTGKTIIDMEDLEFPEHYSQQACDIIASKYFRKAGLPTKRGHEESMRQVVDRMVRFWVEALKSNDTVNEEEAKILYDELVYAMLAQYFAPNSPQWFNTGLKLAYGITGGHSELYYFDPESGEVKISEDDYTRTQASACFILSIEDKLLGRHSISDHYVTETKLFKGGSGTGTNFSNIRAAGEGLSGGGCSSGLMSFLRGLDRNAGAIKSGGTTRRAAKMVCLDCDHPEIEDFISWKAKEEDKVVALAKMGYDGDIDGEAYNTVSGQNSNNSVQFSDEFMQKVAKLDEEPDAVWELKGRVDESANREIKVKELWDLFNQSSWRCADPAPQYADTFNAWHTCPAGEDGEVGARHNRINSTNPCGEYSFLDDTSCNLASINVFKFLKSDYEGDDCPYDLDSFLHMVTLAQLVLEASIVWGQFPTEDIARKTYNFRTTGLGFANLHALLLSLALPYDSDEARAIAAALAGLMTGHSYRVSALMAERVGAFAKFDLNKEHMMRVMRNHARAAGSLDSKPEGLGYNLPKLDHGLLRQLNFGDLSEALRETWTECLAAGEEYGYRNAQVSVMAPTGTISFAMDCASTSIEPFFSHVVYKKLVGGGFMKLANPLIKQALLKLGYTAAEASEIEGYIMREEDGMLVDGKFEGAPHLKPEHYPILDTANAMGTGERFIHHLGHVKMVAAISPLISGAISKTVNLPSWATVEDFAAVVLEAWKLGVKGITLYRDGSKFAQPLNLKLQGAEADELPLAELSYHELLRRAEEQQEEIELMSRHHISRRDKLSGVRSGRTHPAQIDDVKIYCTVNRNEEGEIAEIYITTDREGTLIMGLLNSLSKTISVMLQYHIPAKDIAKMLRGQKYEPYGFVSRHPHIKFCSSISDLIAKIIDIESGDFSRVQIKEGELPDSVGHNLNVKGEDHGQRKTIGNEHFVHVDAVEAAKNGEKLYDSICPDCSSSRMVRNGTCKVCLDCGATTGCS